MRRREFLVLTGVAAAAWPMMARGQQAGKIGRVGVLGPGLNNPTAIAIYRAFLSELKEHDLNDGQNLSIEYRSVNDPRGPFVSAAELMRWQPDLIVAVGPEVALQAVVGASRSIPIVIVAVNYDPIQRGYVASLSRPGGNITGVVAQQLELAEKQVELLTQAFPEKTRLFVFWDEQTTDQFGAAEQAARSSGIQVRGLKLENPPYDFDAAFSSAEAGAAQMGLFLSSPLFFQHRSRIVELAVEHRIPCMFILKLWAEAGGLMSYGVDYVQLYRRAADYVAKILKGEKPADLPVEQAIKFELVVNLKTARKMGVTLPPAIMLRADEVIE